MPYPNLRPLCLDLLMIFPKGLCPNPYPIISGLPKLLLEMPYSIIPSLLRLY